MGRCRHGGTDDEWCDICYRETNPYHNARCLENQKEYQEFEAKYPDYCQDCNAQGGHIERATNAWLECRFCVAKGYCPVCAGPLTTSVESSVYDYQKCGHCGFDEAKLAAGDQEPPYVPDPTCYCDEEADRRMYQAGGVE